jgi:hypothetical protein
MKQSDVVQAIWSRHAAELRYDDEDELRIVYPHVLYRTESGAVELDAYQVLGPSRSGHLPGWRIFEVERIAEFAAREERFDPPPDYHPDSDRYSHGVIARVVSE